MSTAFKGSVSRSKAFRKPSPEAPLAKWVEDKKGGHWEFPHEVKIEEPEYVEQTYGELV